MKIAPTGRLPRRTTRCRRSPLPTNSRRRILLIHGEADNNSGTFPIQSERFFSALKGHGATVRFVLLPLESHGYAARESVLHMFWEMNNWLSTYVKNPGSAVAAAQP